jgi:glycosyltransferase involved in cell wall biosynthesis
MKRAGVTHVHAHFANHPAVAGLIINRLTGIPFSFTAHGSDLHKNRLMLDKKVEAAAFVAAISSYNREMIVQECGERVRHKVHVIHCGIDPAVFLPEPKPASAVPVQIVCVGSLIEVKGHQYLIEACASLRDRGIPFRCHLIGEGALRRQLETQISKFGLNHHIKLHGGLPRDKVAQMFRNADVAALTSVQTKSGKREGIPVVLMEAMACELPVVASDISGIPELVESGETGFLVPPRDSAAIAQALETLASNKEMRRLMGKAGRTKVLREFNLQHNAVELLRQIKEVQYEQNDSSSRRKSA